MEKMRYLIVITWSLNAMISPSSSLISSMIILEAHIIIPWGCIMSTWTFDIESTR